MPCMGNHLAGSGDFTQLALSGHELACINALSALPVPFHIQDADDGHVRGDAVAASVCA